MDSSPVPTAELEDRVLISPSDSRGAGVLTWPFSTADLAGIYRYRRVGHDERDLELCPNGTIGVGKGRAERSWSLHFTNQQQQLRIRGDYGNICRLNLHPDGCWRGAWTQFERMPVELIPCDEPDGTNGAIEQLSRGTGEQATGKERAFSGEAAANLDSWSNGSRRLKILWIMSDFAQGGISRYTKDLFDVLEPLPIEFRILYVNEFFTDEATKSQLKVPCERYRRKKFQRLLLGADLVSTPGINLWTPDHQYILKTARSKLIGQVHGTCQYSRDLVQVHLPYTKRFVSCSRAAAKLLPEGCDVLCPPFPLDFQRFIRQRTKASARRQLGIPRGLRVVTVACRQAHDKNLIGIAQAVRSLPDDVVLLCVGDGYAKDELHVQMREVLGPRLFLKSWVTTPTEYLDASDCFICLSHHEGGPMTVLEALIHGTPVVSTPVGIVSELFVPRPGKSDLAAVFHYQSPDDILRAIKFTNKSELRQISEYVAERSRPELIRRVWWDWLLTLVRR